MQNQHKCTHMINNSQIFDSNFNYFRLHLVVEALEASSYHGFVARLTRSCVDALQRGRLASTPTDDADLISVPFCTALFSFLYHLAGYDNGSFSF